MVWTIGRICTDPPAACQRQGPLPPYQLELLVDARQVRRLTSPDLLMKYACRSPPTCTMLIAVRGAIFFCTLM